MIGSSDETKYLKALYFDLSVRNLKKYYSETNPNRAYRQIRDYLLENNFSHEQYSGYHSNYQTTVLEIMDLIQKMSRTLPWLPICLNHFEVTNIGSNHDLMLIFDKEISKPKAP